MNGAGNDKQHQGDHMTHTENSTIKTAYPSLSRFRCRAVVDWLDLRITTAKPTNFMTVQAEITAILGNTKPVYVAAQDEGPGRAATIFDIRFHDPNRWTDLTDCMEQMAVRFPFAAPPEVVKLELAVDFYSRHDSPSDLYAMTERLMRELAADGLKPRQHIHIAEGLHITKFLLDDEIQWKTNPRFMMYVGNRDDEQAWRVYLKQTDCNKTPIADSKQHRARVEVTLSGEPLAAYCITLQGMADMRFERLSDKFRFRDFKSPEVSPALQGIPRVLALRVAKRLRIAAQAGYCALWRSKRRKFSEHSRADTELNTMVRQSLRNLTQRFCAEKRGKIREESSILPLSTPSALITVNTVALRNPPGIQPTT